MAKRQKSEIATYVSCMNSH